MVTHASRVTIDVILIYPWNGRFESCLTHLGVIMSDIMYEEWVSWYLMFGGD